MKFLIVFLALTTLLVNYPGHLSYDSLIQLDEGITGYYQSIHPPIMSFLLGLFNSIIPGTGLFLMFNIFLFYTSLFIFFGNFKSLQSKFTLCLLCLNPVILNYSGIIWKDVLFCNISLLSFSLITLKNSLNDKYLKIFLTSLIIISASLVSLTRQTGIVVSLIIILTLIKTDNYRQKTDSIKQGTCKLLIAKLNFFKLCLVTLTMTVISKLMDYLALMNSKNSLDFTSSTSTGFRILQIYDIAGITYRNLSDQLSILQEDDVSIDLLKSQISKYYSPLKHDYMNSPETGPGVASLLSQVSNDDIFSQWLLLIKHHPFDYIIHRTGHYFSLMGFAERYQCLPFITGISGPESLIVKYSNILSESLFTTILHTYSIFFVKSLLYRPIFYFSISVVLLFIFYFPSFQAKLISTVFPRFSIKKYNSFLDDKITILKYMLISSIAFSIPYYFIGLACDFRYVYFSTASTLIAMAYVICICCDKTYTNSTKSP